jgi:hypothetical protein
MEGAFLFAPLHALLKLGPTRCPLAPCTIGDHGIGRILFFFALSWHGKRCGSLLGSRRQVFSDRFRRYRLRRGHSRNGRSRGGGRAGRSCRGRRIGLGSGHGSDRFLFFDRMGTCRTTGNSHLNGYASDVFEYDLPRCKHSLNWSNSITAAYVIPISVEDRINSRHKQPTFVDVATA